MLFRSRLPELLKQLDRESLQEMRANCYGQLRTYIDSIIPKAESDGGADLPNGWTEIDFGFRWVAIKAPKDPGSDVKREIFMLPLDSKVTSRELLSASSKSDVYRFKPVAEAMSICSNKAPCLSFK